MTKLRTAMIALFLKSSKPQAASAIMMALLKQGVSVNKTSVYRELEFLIGKGVIKTVNLSDEEMLYERADDHHHHIVCRECKTVEDVRTDAVEDILLGEEKIIARKSEFSEIRHSLEFFGRCGRCQ